MKVTDNTAVHVSTSAQFDEQKYCALVTVISCDEVRDELRFAQGDKLISETLI